MSKLTIFLCAVLFASAVNASVVSDVVVSATQKVEGLVTNIIATAEEKFNDIKDKARELVAKLEAAANAQKEKIFEEIKSKLEQIQVEINKLTGKDHGVDVTACNRLVEHLDHIGLAVIANTSSCITKKLDTARKYVHTIVTLSDTVLANLTTIREEARHCGDNVDSISSAANAILCTNLAAAKATWVATKKVPALTIEMTKITYLLVTLQPSLAYCTATNGLVTFYHESSTIVEKTKQCIREKIESVRPDGEEVEYTTGKVSSEVSTARTEEVPRPENVADKIVDDPEMSLERK